MVSFDALVHHEPLTNRDIELEKLHWLYERQIATANAKAVGFGTSPSLFPGSRRIAYIRPVGFHDPFHPGEVALLDGQAVVGCQLVRVLVQISDDGDHFMAPRQQLRQNARASSSCGAVQHNFHKCPSE